MNNIVSLRKVNNYFVAFENKINESSESEINTFYDIHNYFEMNLSNYIILDIKQYEHPEDSYLFKVLAVHKANNTFAYWSTWNTHTKCLNHGHYGYDDFDDVIADYDSVGKM